MSEHALPELLVAILAHGQHAQTIEDFLVHPLVQQSREDVQSALDSLVNKQVLRSDISTYPPQDGETVYLFGDNERAQQVFNTAIARG